MSLADIHISIYLPKAGAELETDCTGREAFMKNGENEDVVEYIAVLMRVTDREIQIGRTFYGETYSDR